MHADHSRFPLSLTIQSWSSDRSTQYNCCLRMWCERAEKRHGIQNASPAALLVRVGRDALSPQPLNHMHNTTYVQVIVCAPCGPVNLGLCVDGSFVPDLFAHWQRASVLHSRHIQPAPLPFLLQHTRRRYNTEKERLTSERNAMGP